MVVHVCMGDGVMSKFRSVNKILYDKYPIYAIACLKVVSWSRMYVLWGGGGGGVTKE